MNNNFLHMSAMNRMISKFMEVRNLEELGDLMKQSVDEYISSQGHGIYLYDFERTKFRVLYSTGAPAQYIDQMEKIAMKTLPGEVFKTKKMIHIPDIGDDDPARKWIDYKEFTVRSRLYLPILNQDECLGVFGIVSDQANNFSKERIETLSFICNLSGTAYQNLLNREKIKQASSQIEILYRMREETPNPVLRINSKNQLIYHNPASEPIIQYYLLQIGSALPSVFDETIQKTKEERQNIEKEFIIGARTYSLLFTPLKDSEDLNIFGRDITDKILILEEQRQHAQMAEKADTAIARLSIYGSIQWVNSSFLKLFNIEDKDSILKTRLIKVLENQHIDFHYLSSIINAIEQRKNRELNFRIQDKDGKPKYVRMTINPIYQNDNQLNILIIYLKDITKEIKYQEDIRLNEYKLKKYIDNSLDGFIVINEIGTILNSNRQASIIWQYSESELNHLNLFELTVDDLTQKQLKEDLTNFSEHYTPKLLNQRFELTGKRGKNESFILEMTMTAIRIEHNYQFSAFFRDITEQKRAKEELVNINSRLSILISNLNVGIVVENERREIVLINQKLCDFFQSPDTPAKLKGQDCSQSADKVKVLFSNPEEFVQDIDKLLNDKKTVYNQELRMVDGTFLNRDYLPIFSENKFLGNLWMYRNVTKEKKSAQRLSEAKLLAEKANQAKSLFLANMSHEIRTPMNAIYGIIKLLEDYKLSQTQQKLLRSLKFSAESLLQIINDILDLSKIESGKLILQSTTFELKNLIDQIIQIHQFKAKENRILLKLNYDEKIPGLLTTDPIRLKQVITNLISNAIKFTQHGYVELECRLKKETTKKCTIEFLIHDTGIGIDQKSIDSIFSKFEQANSSISAEFGGTGLGLSISSQIIKMMNSHIQVKSTLGKGSTFSFIITVDKGKKIQSNLKTTIQPDFELLKGKKILLVEDLKINQDITKAILKKWKLEVHIAINGKDAICQLDSWKPDLILMDKQMPKMDGIEATIHIRQQMKSDIPIIILTANVLKEVIDECLKAGANDYQSKPFDPDKLLLKIAQQTGAVRMESPSKNFQTKETTKRGKTLYDTSQLIKMFGDDKAMIQQMIHELRHLLPKQIEELIHDGEQKNWNELHQAAHKLKSSVALIAKKSIWELVQEIEMKSQEKTGQSDIPDLIKELSHLSCELLRQLNEKFD